MVQDRKPVKQHGNRRQSKSWTLLLVGEFGKIASFRVSKALLLSLLVTLVVFLGYSIILTTRYDRLRSENNVLKGDLEKTAEDLISANEAKDKALVRLMFLAKEDKPESKPTKEKKKKKRIAAKKPKLVISKKTEVPAAKNPDSHDTSSSPAPAIKEVDTSDASSGETEPAKESTGTQSTETTQLASATSKKVLIQEFEIQTTNNGTALRFKFKLENIAPQDKKITGYTFVVLEPEKDSKEPTRISPWSPLKDGRPTKIRRGQYFGIARFKYVRGTLPDIMDVSRFKSATVYVYSPAGDLLTKKIHDVDVLLRS